MRIALVDTYYRRFLSDLYARTPSLKAESFQVQRQALIGARFGTSDFYSSHLETLGWEAFDLIVNCVPLQAAWARENGRGSALLQFPVPHRFYRIPVLGQLLAALPGLLDVAVAQIRALKPDILFCHDLSFFPPGALQALKADAKLIVGQVASPLPPREFLAGYDLILTSFPHFVSEISALGIASEYFRLGFEPRVATECDAPARDIDISFVGGVSRAHKNAIPLLEHLARNTPIRFFGYGADELPASSPIKARYEREVWGLDMYRIMARSKITINRHIAIARNNANNMRLYESTGMGALLLTERKDNLAELFEPDREVAVYSDPQEAVARIEALLADPDQLRKIAAAGNARTLRDHTYQARMQELSAILVRHLKT
jgi:spore maturation protein CgeB